MTTTANASTTLTHIRLTEPALTFDPVDAAQQHLNPLAGLTGFGPYSAAAWETDHQRVRVAILAPHDAIDPIRTLRNELRDCAEPRERRDYLPPYPGFKSAFHAALVPADEAARQPLPEDLDRKMAASAEPHIILARALTEGLGRLAAVRSLFDVVVFYLPQRWEPRFVVGEFDLHDYVKAAGARLGLPTQIVTDLAMAYHCRASVRWRLATALYAKAGGIPYKLATGGMMDSGTAYVGLAYGIRDSGRPANSFVVCCSQLFDGQGGGLEFVAHDVSGDVDPRNPYLTRLQMRSILSRSLNIYAGHPFPIRLRVPVGWSWKTVSQPRAAMVACSVPVRPARLKWKIKWWTRTARSPRVSSPSRWRRARDWPASSKAVIHSWYPDRGPGWAGSHKTWVSALMRVRIAW
jgi:hypothetical protein